LKIGNSCISFFPIPILVLKNGAFTSVFKIISAMQSVEGMKVVCHELAQATNDPEGNAMDELVKDADRLVSCLADKAR